MGVLKDAFNNAPSHDNLTQKYAFWANMILPGSGSGYMLVKDAIDSYKSEPNTVSIDNPCNSVWHGISSSVTGMLDSYRSINIVENVKDVFNKVSAFNDRAREDVTNGQIFSAISNGMQGVGTLASNVTTLGMANMIGNLVKGRNNNILNTVSSSISDSKMISDSVPSDPTMSSFMESIGPLTNGKDEIKNIVAYLSVASGVGVLDVAKAYAFRDGEKMKELMMDGYKNMLDNPDINDIDISLEHYISAYLKDGEDGFSNALSETFDSLSKKANEYNALDDIDKHDFNKAKSDFTLVSGIHDMFSRDNDSSFEFD